MSYRYIALAAADLFGKRSRNCSDRPVTRYAGWGFKTFNVQLWFYEIVINLEQIFALKCNNWEPLRSLLSGRRSVVLRQFPHPATYLSMQQRATSPPGIAHAGTDATDDSRVSNDTRSVIENTSISSGNDSIHNANPVVEMNGNSPAVHSDLAGNPRKQARDRRCSSPYLSTCLYTNRSDAIRVTQKPEDENKRARQPKIPTPLTLMRDT
ncbi:hypothetical protein ARMGADRAFT_1069985 [Armillaria gallica]|uniref:Uncharacterized protein n=1 Tax=Armillaria gallica TaxID=47427 RepID=A0A2H3E7P3_ARMGA|nr:hypothetical protein ARMGADRAFT_1069985 [Armillaria gallica]